MDKEIKKRLKAKKGSPKLLVSLATLIIMMTISSSHLSRKESTPGETGKTWSTILKKAGFFPQKNGQTKIEAQKEDIQKYELFSSGYNLNSQDNHQGQSSLAFSIRNQSGEAKKNPSGSLQVLHVSPQGPTSAPHEAEKIVVIFDRPMVPLEALPEKKDSEVKARETGRFEEVSFGSQPALIKAINVTSPEKQSYKEINSRDENRKSGKDKIDESRMDGNGIDGNKKESFLETKRKAEAGFENVEPAPAQPLLKIEPKTPGQFRWLGSRTLVFTPDRRFPFSTSIKVTIPATTTALDGSRLGYEYSWQFETIRPRLVHHRPAHNDNWLPLNPEILLIFNQPMDEERAAPFISWQALPSKKNLPIKISRPEAEKLKEEGFTLPADYVLLLTLEPSTRLDPETECQISLKKGLPGKEGHLGLEKDYTFNFKTYNYFRFEGLVEPDQVQRRTEQVATLKPTRIFSPDEPLPFKFSNPIGYKEFVSKVKFKPEIKIPDYYYEWEETSPLIYLSLPLEAETNYEVIIPADLYDEFGNKLGQTYTIYFTTGSFPPSVSMTTGYGVIEASTQPAPHYFLEALNQKSVHIQATRLSPEDVVPVVRQKELFRSDKFFLPFAGFFQVEKEFELHLPTNKRRIVPINLVDLHPSFNRGFIFLQIDTGGEADKWDRYLKVLLQITEIGLSAKFSAENIIVWVTELKTGLPARRASLEIRDQTNTIRWRGETDDNGQVEAPGWKKLGLKPDPKQYGPPKLWIFARQGEDVAFTSSDWDYGIDPFRFNLPFDWSPEPAPFKGYIFTERGIYRAGEIVHIKGIIREKIRGEWQIPDNSASLNVEITDPVGQTVYKAPVHLDEFGSFNFDYKSSEDSALGLYVIKARWPLPEANKQRATEFRGTFRIEAFRPVNFEVHLRSDKDSYVFDDEFGATVRANYLFGGAMSGQNVAWSLHFDQTFFTPPGHRGFIFGNQIDWDEEESFGEKESRLVASQEAKLDSQGRLIIKIPLKAEKEKDSVRATLEATVTGPDRTSVSNRLQTIIHRGEFYIGLRPSTTFLKKGEPIEVEVIAALPDGRLVAGKKINLKLIRREWHSVRQAGVGRRWRWRSEREDREIDSQMVTTESEPVRLKFRPDKAGFYFFLASGTDSRGNTISTTTGFYVSGNDYVPWEQREDDTIELVPEATSYRPGEVSRILVKSPYERAKALVTIEREFILEAKVIELVGTSSFIEIPIFPEYIPNIFVSVLLVKGRTSPPEQGEARDDLGIPSFKIGYTQIAIDPAEKRLEVKFLGIEPEYRPRDKVSFKLKVESQGKPVKGASVALACVDLGVLNLIGYEMPDLFSFFYGPQPLSVRTSETRIHIVSQRQLGEKGEEPGGGFGEKALAMAPSMAEIMLREDFKSTAYWAPSVITDERGEATISFNLPDNLTTFQVMAVVQTKDSLFGRGETSFRVVKKLMLQPSFPRFCRIGDDFEAGVVIHNFSQAKGEVLINLDFSGINLVAGTTNRQFSLRAGESREILFRFKAEKSGEARFSFRARMASETDGLQIKMPIELPRITETVALAGELNREEKAGIEERIIFPEKVFPDQTFLEVITASSALVGLSGCLESLENYPYGCLEQKVSALLPYLVAKKLILDFKLTSLSEREINDLIRQRLKEIITFQKQIGGFSVWPDSGEISPFVTCYATHALIKAREAGFAINPQILARAANYLLSYVRSERNHARQPYGLRTFNSTRAYALYILNLLKRPQPALMERLYADRNNLSLFGKAYLLKAIHQSRTMDQAKEALIKEFLNKIKVTAGEAHFEDDEGRDGGWIFSSNGRTTAIILQALIETGIDHPVLSAVARWLVNRQLALMKGSFFSTQENFYLFWALSEFYRAKEKDAADFRGSFRLAEKYLVEEKFTPEIREVKKARFSLEDLIKKQRISPAQEYPLKVEKEGRGTLYYGLKLIYAPAFPAPPREEGIAVIKRINPLEQDRKGRTPGEIKAGSLAVVTLEIAVPQELLYVVVEDPLPAGFEAINPSFVTESEEAQRRLEELISAQPSKPKPWWTGFRHIERHDNRVILFADSLTPGVHVHHYLVRALNFGTYIVPGTRAEQMYAPEVFGRSPEMTIKIVK